MAGLMVLLLGTMFPCRGQQTLKKLEPSDYERWGQLKLRELSADGRWVSYSMAYSTGADTLFIKETSGNRTYAYPQGRQGTFAGTTHYACSVAGTLQLLDLTTGKQETMGMVESLSPLPQSSQLLFTSPFKNGWFRITLLEPETMKKCILDSITNYRYSRTSRKLAAVASTGSQFSVVVLDVSTGKRDTVYRGQDLINGSLVIRQDGSALAFAERDTEYDRVTSVNIKSRTRYVIPVHYPASNEARLTTVPQKPAYSADGKSLAFYLQPKGSEMSVDSTAPEVWNALDRELYPARIASREAGRRPVLAVWDIRSNHLQVLTDSVNPNLMLTPDYRYTLQWNPLEREPDPTDSRAYRYTLWDRKNGVKKPLLKNPDTFSVYMETSPDGRFVTYFDGRDWMAFEFSSGVHHNLTRGLPVAFGTEKDGRLTNIPFSSAGWDKRGRFIIYDNFDIWALQPGKQAKRLTRGREQGMRYRIALPTEGYPSRSNYNGAAAPLIDLEKPVLLEVSKAGSGYAVLYPKGRVKPICSGTDFYSQGILSKKGDVMVCMRQNYDRPPCLLRCNADGVHRLLYQSNTQYTTYGVQRAERLSYATASGRALSGMLYYPLGFDSTANYPTVVHIYEDQSWQTNRYVNPSLYNPAGFCITNYTGAGYFVFLPDIEYDGGNPGEDALACVEAGILKIKENKNIDPHRMGLIGHSFGGYQANYIIGHSKSFAAAVSGAPINDLVSFYHYVVPGVFRPNFSNLENGQFRMEAPYFKQPSAYTEASPLYSAAAVSAPLLSWGGKDDPQIDPSQLTAFYLAMRRMGKDHVMLAYPGEGHIITSREQQADLTLKIMEWFDHHLKGLPSPDWAKAE
ncbi:prolyl oligopeptidase family serine peptidase [Flavobacterium alkalisoli]|uniref:S9 family peptidase n=1 Tax=Flavobacterium alkalisoli TaxID=2602769 RepID=UPI003A9503BF